MNTKPNYSAFKNFAYIEIEDDDWEQYSVGIDGPYSDTQRTDEHGNTCSTLSPYITSTLSATYDYYSSDVDSFNITTYHPKGLLSYNVSVLNADDSSFVDTWIDLDFANFDSEHKVQVNLDFKQLGVLYDLNTLSFTVKFKTSMEDGLAYSTQDVTFDVTNDPVLITNVTNQIVRSGKVASVTLDTRINPNRIISDYSID